MENLVNELALAKSNLAYVMDIALNFGDSDLLE